MMQVNENKSSLVELSEEDKISDTYPINIQAFWLIVWMSNNILVTMINKAAFAQVDFKYPYTLSTIHMACNVIGSHIYYQFNKNVKPKALSPDDYYPILIFSLVFSLNIAIGNTSLRWVSVNFNQVSRSLVPVLVMLISMIYYKKTYSSKRKLAILPIVIGVALTFYGDISFTYIGAFYTMLCIILAALKAVVGGELLSGELKLHEIDLLYKMCPLALFQIGFMSIMSGEISQIVANWDKISQSAAPKVVLLSGLLSFSLNVSSFIANKVTSALTLSISANVKQVLMVVISTLYFGDNVGLVNGLGILLVIIGSFRYGTLSVTENKR